MIKNVLICIYLLLNNNDEPLFVKEFHNLKTKHKEQLYLDKYQNDNNINVQAYIIALQMKKAEYTWNPIKKIQIFKKQKQRLNHLITNNPNNIHFRYIRLLLQEKIPQLLNYHKNTQEDKQKLNNWLSKKDSTDYLDIYIKQNTTL